ncbi:MAG: hypothetical protein V3V20_11545 [Algisphaera sp.]
MTHFLRSFSATQKIALSASMVLGLAWAVTPSAKAQEDSPPSVNTVSPEKHLGALDDTPDARNNQGPWDGPGPFGHGKPDGPPAYIRHGGPPQDGFGAGGPPRHGMGAQGDPPALTPQQIEQATALMEELNPEMAQRLAALRDGQPEKAREIMSQRFPRLRHMLTLKEKDPAMYDLRIRDIHLAQQTAKLARDLANPAEDQTPDMLSESQAALRAALSEHFEVRQMVRRAQMEHLRQRLVEMEAKLNTDAGQRDALIAQRYEQLLASPPPHRGMDTPRRRRDADDFPQRRGNSNKRSPGATR